MSAALLVPNFLRSAAYSVCAYRDGLAGWRSYRDEFRAMLRADPESLRSQSAAKLARLLEHARKTVPYYRRGWSDISGPLTADRLPALPILTKDDLVASKATLVSELYDRRKLDADYTSGTTHARTGFYRDRRCTVARFGRQWGVLEHLGYRPGDRRGLVWGVERDLPGRGLDLKARFRRFASAQEVLFCCQWMSRDDLRDYHARLQRLRPRVLYGYPSAIEEFARFIEAERLSPIRVARIFCTAERLTPARRAVLEAAFGAEVFDLYCTREHGCIGFECARHRGFHLDIGSVWVEIVDDDGRPAPRGASGRIVTTDLLNYGMPLVRYAIGDVGALATEPCACGCPLPLLARLDGRVADLLYRPDGSIVVGHLFGYAVADLPAVQRVQFVQQDARSLDVNLVLQPGAALDFADALTARLRRAMGPEVDIRLHVVPDIPRNPRSGKFQEVICHVAAGAGRTLPAAGSARP